MTVVSRDDPSSADAAALLVELSRVLTRITGSSGEASFDPDDVRGASSRFVVARAEDGTAIGCGAFRALNDEIAEVKRMYARPGHPGVGIAVLAFLENEARQLGYRALRLETRLVNKRAITFYERNGYRRIPNFGKYAGNDAAVCFEKRLV